MTYYKVLPQYDQKHTSYKNGKWNGYFHIANELLTAKEIELHRYKKEYCIPVEVPKNNVYWLFGARFERRLTA